MTAGCVPSIRGRLHPLPAIDRDLSADLQQPGLGPMYVAPSSVRVPLNEVSWNGVNSITLAPVSVAVRFNSLAASFASPRTPLPIAPGRPVRTLSRLWRYLNG